MSSTDGDGRGGNGKGGGAPPVTNRRAGMHFSRQLTPDTLSKLQKDISTASRQSMSAVPSGGGSGAGGRGGRGGGGFGQVKPSTTTAACLMGTRQPAAGRARPMSMQVPKSGGPAMATRGAGRGAGRGGGGRGGGGGWTKPQAGRTERRKSLEMGDAKSSGAALGSISRAPAIPSPTKRISALEAAKAASSAPKTGSGATGTANGSTGGGGEAAGRLGAVLHGTSDSAGPAVRVPVMVLGGVNPNAIQPYVPAAAAVPAAAQPGQKVSKSAAEYEVCLRRAQHRDFSDIAKLNIVHIAGKDSLGRPVVVALPANLPAKKINLDDLMLYCITVLDPIVENDYVVVFVNTNASNHNRPTIAWLKRAYGIFNRKYKKNLKNLYIVHPNFFVKMTLKLCRPFISSKFWKKVIYVDNLVDIYKTIDRNQIEFPDYVIRHNAKVNSREPVFGAPLYRVLQIEYSKTGVPEVVDKCTKYLYNYTEVEGIFRKSGGAAYIEELKQSFNRGENVDLSEVDDPHAVCGLVKLFLRELPDPLMTFDLYEGFVQTQVAMGKGNEQHWAATVKSLLCNIPKENLRVLKILFDLSQAVVAKSEKNLMTSSNLAIVLGPNLLKAREETLISAMKDTPIVNGLVKRMIDLSDRLFGQPHDWSFMMSQYAVEAPLARSSAD